MPEDEALDQIQALDAIAAEEDAVLAFRVCEETGDFEPVFLRLFRANAEADNETALVAISDTRGLSLGRYIVPRDRLDRALEQAEAIDAEPGDGEPELGVVPHDWEELS
ncbi:MAG TPA: hypothetical protein VHJ54_01325 [Solirubrobacterales bacterium]|jgi:hypothetical protein|nr:hypothetical protein [Solirubrobacterales bacterium]